MQEQEISPITEKPIKTGFKPLSEKADQVLYQQLFPYLTQWQETKNISQVLLLSGIHTQRKNKLAKNLARWILCIKRTTTLYPCGECRSCTLSLKEDNWVDYTVIQHEETGEQNKGSLKIDQFRDLKSSIGHSGFESSYRVIQISNAEEMTPQAANSLLKILEEPPSHWVIILTVSDTTRLLPTILSRCIHIRLKPYSTQFIEENFATMGVAQSITFSKRAQGSWDLAETLSSKEMETIFEQVQSFINRPTPIQEFNSLFEWGSQSHENFQKLLNALELKLHEQISTQNIPPQHSEEKFFSWLELLFEARNLALTPINRKLLVQDVLTMGI